jgi:hypothetical protein
MILSLIFSKLGGLVAGALGFLAIFLWGKYKSHQVKALKAENAGLKAEKELAKDIQEVKDETNKKLEEADKMDVNSLADAFSKLHDIT